jgi:hydroxyethylthiazole kinase-like uncharacterized protein yjeF
MREFDEHAIRGCGVPGLILMENAGRGVADVVEREVFRGTAHGKRVVVVCGAGNNGGDGYVVARHLRGRGADVSVFATVDPAGLRGDARTNYDAYIGVGGTVEHLEREDDLRALSGALASAEVVIDAVFGTGLSRPIEGDTAEVIESINAARAPRVAIDVPSGIDADTGATLGVSVHAERTVTFAHPKLGLLTTQGALASGVLHVVDLGVPSSLGPARTPAAEVFEREDAVRLLPSRPFDTHKYRAGHVGVFAGSGGKTGAALMVGRAALRTGAGLATIATWEEAAPGMQGRVTEEMVATLARGAGVARSVEEALAGRKAIVVGPGFGTDADARAAVETILASWKGPAVYDADALSLFVGHLEAFAAAEIPCVLSPHAGEAARLLGTTSSAIEADRFAAVQALAARARAVVILKGAYTLIAAPPGASVSWEAVRERSGAPVAVHAASCPALATAGSGDTLSGIVGALSCALRPFDAACAGVFLHADAATAWSERHGDRGLLASEIADEIPDAIARLTGARSRNHARGLG